MARSFSTNPLQLKPRTPRSQEGESPVLHEDFEPRLRFYMDEVRRSWPGGAPVSWKESVRLRQWPSAFPGVHWAAVECLLELGRASRDGLKEITLAWQTLALGAVHVVVDGGGLPSGMPSATLAGLLKRAEDCLPAFAQVYQAGFVSVDEIVMAIKRLSQHPEVHPDILRAGFVGVLADVLEFRERLNAPAGTDLVSAFHYVFIEHPNILRLALQLSAFESRQELLVSQSSGVPPNESDALLQSLLQVADQMGLAEGQVSPPPKDRLRPRGLEDPLERRRREGALSSPSGESGSIRHSKPMPRLVPRASSSSRRRPSDLKTESAWSQPESAGWKLPFRFLWSGLVIGGTCVLGVFVIMAGHWTSKSRVVGEEVSERVTSLPNPLDTVDAFAYAPTVEEKIALLQEPSDAEAAREHFANVGDKEFKVDHVQSLGKGRSGGLSFHASRIRFQDGGSRFVAVLTDPETGRLSIDWPAYARTASMPLRHIMQGAGDGATIRAFVKRGDYYNFAFEDAQLYACYEIIWPDTEEVLYGYVELRTKRHSLIEALLVKSRRQRVVLRLRAPTAEAEPVQYGIEEVVANDWVADPAGSLEHSAFASDVGFNGDFSTGPVWGPSR